MQSISIIRSLVMFCLTFSSVVQAQSFVTTLSKNFTQQNMVQGLKSVKSLAYTHKYKTGVAVLLLSGLSGSIWYRNSCLRARAAQAKAKKTQEALAIENKRLSEEALREAELIQQQRQAELEAAEKAALEQKRLAAEREAKYAQYKRLIEEEQGESHDLRRRGIEFDERLEAIDEKVNGMLEDIEENNKRLPDNLERALDICGLLTDDAQDFGIQEVEKVLNRAVTVDNYDARVAFRKVAIPYINSLENILSALEGIVDSDELTDIDPELLATYDQCEDRLIETYQKCKDILCLEIPEEA